MKKNQRIIRRKLHIHRMYSKDKLLDYGGGGDFWIVKMLSTPLSPLIVSSANNIFQTTN